MERCCWTGLPPYQEILKTSFVAFPVYLQVLRNSYFINLKGPNAIQKIPPSTKLCAQLLLSVTCEQNWCAHLWLFLYKFRNLDEDNQEDESKDNGSLRDPWMSPSPSNLSHLQEVSCDSDRLLWFSSLPSSPESLGPCLIFSSQTLVGGR